MTNLKIFHLYLIHDKYKINFELKKKKCRYTRILYSRMLTTNDNIRMRLKIADVIGNGNW